jgi:hypothetical protein
MFFEGVLWMVPTGSTECRFSKLRQFKRVAVKYEKIARYYLAVVTRAATITIAKISVHSTYRKTP